MGVICGRGGGGGTHELVHNDLLCVWGAVYMHLNRCRLFMG